MKRNDGLKKGTWLYWKWPNEKVFRKNYLVHIEVLDSCYMLHLATSEYDGYPKMIKETDIDIETFGQNKTP